MIMMVLRDPNRLEELLETWRGIEVHPLGILESTGITRQTAKYFGARFAFGFPRGTDSEEAFYTLFALAPDRETVKASLRVAEEALGDLCQTHNGLLTSWRLGPTKGLCVDDYCAMQTEPEDAPEEPAP